MRLMPEKKGEKHFAPFVKISLEFVEFRADFYRNFPDLVESKKIIKQTFVKLELDLN